MTSPTFSLSLTRHIEGASTLTGPVLQAILSEIDKRLISLESQKAEVEAVTSELRQFAVTKVQELIVPAVEDLQDIQEKGFALALSSSSANVTVGNTVIMTIDNDAERRYFTPGSHVLLSRLSTIDDYAIARNVGYVREIGELTLIVDMQVGDVGPHTDWVISALPGSVLLQLALTAQTEQHRDDAQAARDTAIAKATEATDAAATVSSGAATATAAASTATTKADEASASAAAAAASAATVDGPTIVADAQAAATAAANAVVSTVDLEQIDLDAFDKALIWG